MTVTQARFLRPSWERLEGQTQVSALFAMSLVSQPRKSGDFSLDVSSLQVGDKARDVVPDHRQNLAAISGAIYFCSPRNHGAASLLMPERGFPGGSSTLQDSEVWMTPCEKRF